MNLPVMGTSEDYNVIERDYQVIDDGVATHWQKLIELKGLHGKHATAHM